MTYYSHLNGTGVTQKDRDLWQEDWAIFSGQNNRWGGPFKLRPEEWVQVSSGNTNTYRKEPESIQGRGRNTLEGPRVEESKEQEKTIIASALLAKKENRNKEGKNY